MYNLYVKKATNQSGKVINQFKILGAKEGVEAPETLKNKNKRKDGFNTWYLVAKNATYEEVKLFQKEYN